MAKERHDKEKASVLSQELVEEFLVHYYTKEKLGENNGRIKPYLTDSAYREDLAHQEEPLNQVYKDYVLDYRFSDAHIYLDSKQQEALVVFKLRDHHGRVVGANLQGIVEDRSRHSRGCLKRMMKDSQGSIGFSLTLGQP